MKYVVEYNVDQDAFHVDTVERSAARNFEMILNGSDPTTSRSRIS